MQDQKQMSVINKLACLFSTAVQPEKRSMEKGKNTLNITSKDGIEKVVEIMPSPRVEEEKEVDTPTFPRVIEPEIDALHIIPANTRDNIPSVKVSKRTRATTLHVIPDNTGIRT